MKRVERVSNNHLVHVGFKIPSWMRDRIDEVYRKQRFVSRSEAVRHIIMYGFGAMGIDLPSTED